MPVVSCVVAHVHPVRTVLASLFPDKLVERQVLADKPEKPLVSCTGIDGKVRCFAAHVLRVFSPSHGGVDSGAAVARGHEHRALVKFPKRVEDVPREFPEASGGGVLSMPFASAWSLRHSSSIVKYFIS